MPTMKLDHVLLLVRSLDKTEKFYTDVLGFEPIDNGTHQSNILRGPG